VHPALTKPLAGALAICALTAGGACGGDDDHGSAKERGTPSAATADRGVAETKQGNGAASDDQGRANALGAPGMGKQALRSFGKQPGETERASIVAAADEYNAAAAAADVARACAVTSRALTEQLAKSGERVEGKVCGLFPPYTDEMRRKLSKAKVTQVRVQGDHALVVYTVAGPRWNMLPMEREGGIWRLGAYGEWSRTG
jgi:hypothetical protein